MAARAVNITDRAKRYRAQNNVTGPRKCIMAAYQVNITVLDGAKSAVRGVALGRLNADSAPTTEAPSAIPVSSQVDRGAGASYNTARAQTYSGGTV